MEQRQEEDWNARNKSMICTIQRETVSKHTLVLVLNEAQCYEDVRGSGEIAPFFLFGERCASLRARFTPCEGGPGPPLDRMLSVPQTCKQ